MKGKLNTDRQFRSRVLNQCYTEILHRINVSGEYEYFSLDADELKPAFDRILDNVSDQDLPEMSRLMGVSKSKIRSGTYNKVQKILNSLAEEEEGLLTLVINNNFTISQSIRMAEIVRGERVGKDNIISIKREIDQLNDDNWSREKNNSERQSGISNLGAISEKLIETALSDLVDNKTFFRINNSDVQSYGDFVLLCLPNNLWISVKSNFARERLLASGYTTDIIGVGFFTEEKEFTSKGKLRNFQRVGFLAMYLPDQPVNSRQVSSTYHKVIKHYNNQNEGIPRNINGTPFIRPLSQLYEDMKKLYDIPMKDRTTISI